MNSMDRIIRYYILVAHIFPGELCKYQRSVIGYPVLVQCPSPSQANNSYAPKCQKNSRHNVVAGVSSQEDILSYQIYP